MGHRHDYWESLRKRVIPRLGKVSLFLEEVTGKPYYVTSETRNDQLVGRVDMNIENFEEKLHEMGFQRNPISSLKSRLHTSDVEEGSWRKIGFPEENDKQLHLVLYDADEVDNADSNAVYVYAHWEYRWDTNPYKHYKGVGLDPKEGVVRTRRLLDDEGIELDFVQP